jgi:hypothetical protein
LRKRKEKHPKPTKLHDGRNNAKHDIAKER